MTQAEFQNMAHTIPVQPGIYKYFDAQYRVVSYKLGASGGAFPVYQEASNDGNRWSGSAGGIVSKATPGTSIYFDQVRVIGPDGRTIEVPPMVFNLK